jgi:hypothetical protein
MSNERTFQTYSRLRHARHESDDKRLLFHEYSPKSFFQRYGNSYLITFPRRKSPLILGPHWPGIILTLFVIWGGTWLNLRMLSKHGFSQFTTCCFKLFISFFFVSTHVLLMLTATADPGIVFKSGDVRSAEEGSLCEGEYCQVCEVYQPDALRIHHCSDCNYCIEGMDHHCPWMVRTASVIRASIFVYSIPSKLFV